ncbi:MAG: permease prefix domain 1-containing protein [bacterium]
MNWRVLGQTIRRDPENEIEDELAFHLELLTQQYLRAGLSLELANTNAIKRFGNVAEIKRECVAITRRNSPFRRALKHLLIVAFVSGVLTIALSTDFNVRHIGQLLIVLPLLARFLLYVRGLTPRRHQQRDAAPLMLLEEHSCSVPTVDH